jgi:hypothetical protein
MNVCMYVYTVWHVAHSPTEMWMCLVACGSSESVFFVMQWQCHYGMQDAWSSGCVPGGPSEGWSDFDTLLFTHLLNARLRVCMCGHMQDASAAQAACLEALEGSMSE